MQQSGYGEIRTPIFENTKLFERGIGTETDIVTKEMYSWIDQGGNQLTLKPELTAPVVRSYLQHKMGNNYPIHRLYYFDTLFRRERPQKGRQRQFYQFGAEAIGSANPEQDAEIIAQAYNIYQEFDIKNLNVRLNSIGSADIRPKYLDKLRSTIQSIKHELCKTCQERLKKNALRLFDCKNSNCQDLIDKHAPLIFDSISEDDHVHFDTITLILDEMGIPYIHDQKLVRGLDYYTHTTFEITSSVLGAQDALCGGGRYNGLIEQLGGKPTPAVGFAAGVERLILAIENQEKIPKNIDVYLIHMGDKVTPTAVKIANDVRKYCGKIVILETLRRSLKAQMREAGRSSAKITLILGEEELIEKIIIIKDMKTGHQEKVPLSELIQYINS
jgi:histidyl-tRNA synthetase